MCGSFQSTRPMRGATGCRRHARRHRSFQSTRPMRGATCSSVSRSFFGTGFNPRAPCGARRELLQRRGSADCFNPRAPCGARPFASMMMPLRRMFQSTRPMRGATPVLTASLLTTKVSIHAPHAGRDTGLADKVRFNKVSIHAPHAGRDSKRGHDFPPLPRIYGYSPPQIRFSRHLRPTPLLRHDSRTYIFTFCFLFTSPSHSVMNTQMMIAASKS